FRREAAASGPSALATFDALDAHYRDLAAELEHLRARRGLSQRELARRSGLDPAEVSRILGGRSQPRIPTAQKLAQALDAELRIVPHTSPRSVAERKTSKRRRAATRRRS